MHSVVESATRPGAWRGLRYALLSILFCASCSPPPTSVPVTLTAPVPRPTTVPRNLLPPVQAGSRFTYADGTDLVAVPSGEFIMGHGSADNPEHKVLLSEYWIYSTEVTNPQYSLCVDQAWCSPPEPADNPDFRGFDALNKPVVGVTFEQAASYCAFMNAELPTEAQWEKAARGPDGRRYPWGDSEPTCKLLNYNNCTKQAQTAQSNVEGASPFGARNMAGNVYEWVADWYDPVYYKTSPRGDPPGPDTGAARVVRSSGYHSSADQSLSYARSYTSPKDHRPDLGFRCVVSEPAYFAPACSLAPVIDAARAGVMTVDCPALSINVEVTACRYGGGAVVTFNDNHAQDANASFGGIVGCTLLSGQPGTYPLSYQCRKSATAVMSSSCTYQGVPSGDCPAGYELEAASGMCAWPGARATGIDCPAGEFYDPVAHCCRITTANPVDFPVCPVGTVFTETGRDRFACLPPEIARAGPEISKPIDPPVCGNLCELTVELCSVRNLVFCPTTCSCLAVGRKCPEP
jgi:sulfatase modifying factor 1